MQTPVPDFHLTAQISRAPSTETPAEAETSLNHTHHWPYRRMKGIKGAAGIRGRYITSLTPHPAHSCFIQH